MSEPTFIVETCCVCGIRFGIEASYHWFLRDKMGGGDEDNEGYFCCPNGHRQGFTKSSREEYQADLVRAKKRAETFEAKLHDLEATMAYVRKQRDRFKARLSKRAKRKAAPA